MSNLTFEGRSVDPVKVLWYIQSLLNDFSTDTTKRTSLDEIKKRINNK